MMRVGVGDDVAAGNRMLLQRVVAQAGAQAVDVDRAVQAEQPADAVQREPEAELDRRELRADDDEQREARLPVRQPRRRAGRSP